MNEIKNKHLLLVEDQTVIALAEKSILERHGARVTVACGGSEAIEMMSSGDIDLVLMDIDLGSGMDGIAAATEILTHRSVPVIFLSSHTGGEVVERTQSVAAYGYVTKASGEHVLVASINTALRMHAAREMSTVEQDAHAAERHELAQKLNERNQRLEDLADSIPGIIYQLVTRPDGSLSYTYVSKGSERYYGVAADAVLQDPMALLSVIPEEDQQTIAAQVAESSSDLAPGSIVHRIRHSNGALRWIEATSAPHPVGDGSIIWNGVALDVTDRKIAEESLAQATFELKREGEARKLLMQEMDHRVKNSLATAASLISLSEPGDDPGLTRLGERIRTIAFAHELLQDNPGTASVDLEHYLTRVVQSVAEAMAPDSVKITSQIDSIMVNTSLAVHLGLIVNELISNAIEHGIDSANGGSVSVLFRAGAEECTLAVRNTGSAVPTDFSVSDQAGMGLGLVQSLARQYHGVLGVRSGEETEFSITFETSGISR